MFESGLPQVFVSYSKRDNVPHDWLKEFEAYCKFYIRKEYYELRYDEQIEAGDKWLDWIRIAMAKMRVAVLLVGPEFLGSDFILDEELPRLLEAHGEQKRLFILVVRSCAYHRSVLQHFQAFNKPNRPLEQLEVAQRSEIYADLAEAIRKAVEIPIGEGEYERDPISVAISKPGEQDRRIEVRRLIKRDSGSPSIQLELSWQTIGDGVEFLLQQLQEHAPEYVPDLCVGINEFGLDFWQGRIRRGAYPL